MENQLQLNISSEVEIKSTANELDFRLQAIGICIIIFSMIAVVYCMINCRKCPASLCRGMFISPFEKVWQFLARDPRNHQFCRNVNVLFHYDGQGFLPPPADMGNERRNQIQRIYYIAQGYIV